MAGKQRQQKAPFDRTTDDPGNIVELGHVNTQVPDQRAATLFYVTGLGLTRDPYLVTGVDNMWINIGRQQFHLPTREPQVLRGVTGLVVPNLDQLRQRLERVAPELAGTAFAVEDHGDMVETVSPWGNRIRLHAPHPRLGPVSLGMPYLELPVPRGSAAKLVRFYREMMGARAQLVGKSQAEVLVGPDQVLRYQESDADPGRFDGHHIQITVCDFSGPHARLRERGLVTREDDAHQWRFQDLIDLDSGAVLFTLEHEVRSMRHPLFQRPLVNRDPNNSNRHYTPSGEAWNWGLPR